MLSHSLASVRQARARGIEARTILLYSPSDPSPEVDALKLDVMRLKSSIEPNQLVQALLHKRASGTFLRAGSISSPAESPSSRPSARVGPAVDQAHASPETRTRVRELAAEARVARTRPAFRDKLGRWQSQGRDRFTGLVEAETPARIASILDVTQATVSALSVGSRRPSIDLAASIDAHFRLPPALWSAAPPIQLPVEREDERVLIARGPSSPRAGREVGKP